MGRLLEARKLLARPAHALAGAQLTRQSAVAQPKVVHVLQGVLDLLRGERSSKPVCEAVGLAQPHVGHTLDQSRERDLVVVPEQGGCNLGIEDGADGPSQQAVEDGQILAGRVEDLLYVGIGQQRRQRRQIADRQGIDHGCGAVRGHLNRPHLGVVPAFPDKLSVHEQRRGASQRKTEGL